MTSQLNGPTAYRLRVRNPVSLFFSPAPWAALAYLSSYLLLGALWFGLGLAAVLTGGILGILWIGLPVLYVAFAIIRGIARVERARAGIVGVRIEAAYRASSGPGLLPGLRTRLRDPASYCDVLLLVLSWPVLLALDLSAFVLWVVCLGLVSLPFWYRYPPQQFDNGTTGHGIQLGDYPNGPTGSQRYGWFIDDERSALIAAGIGLLLLILVGNYILVGAARLHVRIANALLRPGGP